MALQLTYGSSVYSLADDWDRNEQLKRDIEHAHRAGGSFVDLPTRTGVYTAILVSPYQPVELREVNS